MVKEYPIGTKIRFTAKPHYTRDAQKDSGKCGTIVGYRDGYVKIFLPDTVRVTSNAWTWVTAVNDLTVLPIKGEQLEFDFMKE